MCLAFVRPPPKLCKVPREHFDSRHLLSTHEFAENERSVRPASSGYSEGPEQPGQMEWARLLKWVPEWAPGDRTRHGDQSPEPCWLWVTVTPEWVASSAVWLQQRLPWTRTALAPWTWYWLRQRTVTAQTAVWFISGAAVSTGMGNYLVSDP